MDAVEKSKHRATGAYRETKGLAIAPQIKALEGWGCKRVEPWSEWREWVPRLRRGDLVAVVKALALGPSRKAVAEFVAAVRARQSSVFVIDGNLHSDDADQAMQMVFAAVDQIAGEGRRLSPEEARRRGRMAGKKKARERTANALAKTVWKSSEFADLTNDECLARPEMQGWTESTAYRMLKSRGFATGRPRKAK